MRANATKCPCLFTGIVAAIDTGRYQVFCPSAKVEVFEPKVGINVSWNIVFLATVTATFTVTIYKLVRLHTYEIPARLFPFKPSQQRWNQTASAQHSAVIVLSSVTDSSSVCVVCPTVEAAATAAAAAMRFWVIRNLDRRFKCDCGCVGVLWWACCSGVQISPPSFPSSLPFPLLHFFSSPFASPLPTNLSFGEGVYQL